MHRQLVVACLGSFEEDQRASLFRFVQHADRDHRREHEQDVHDPGDLPARELERDGHEQADRRRARAVEHGDERRALRPEAVEDADGEQHHVAGKEWRVRTASPTLHSGDGRGVGAESTGIGSRSATIGYRAARRNNVASSGTTAAMNAACAR